MTEYRGAQARYYDSYFTGLPGDVEFYRRHAVEAGSPVLEPGCGTGRTLFPVAASGVEITGVEAAPEMLDIARRHVAALPAATSRRVTLRSGDMRDLAGVSGPFRLASLPYRTFQHLLIPEDQRATLHALRDRLVPGGRLILNQFDPTLDVASALYSPPPESVDVSGLSVDTEFTDSATRRRIRVRFRRWYEPADQLLHQEFFYESLRGGRVVGIERGLLTLRYTHRYEMEYLLQACGFRVLRLRGGFDDSPYPGYGEQVWVAQKS